MKKVAVSAVIMARNEEENIAEAIASLGFATQIVVADTGSQDNTIELARGAGAEVHSIEFDGYGSSKNRALEFCKEEWIFHIDADERVSPELAESIIRTVEGDPKFNGYRVSRLTDFLGKPIHHSGWFPDYVLRLFRNGKGKFSERLVHESIRVEGETGKLDGLLYHHSYKDLESYLEKMNVYSSMNAQELHRSGKSSHILDILLHPPAAFLKMYIFRAGFLDGFRGFILASLSAFHVFLKYAKLHQIEHEETAS